MFFFTQAFMFESSFSMAVTEWALTGCGTLSDDYYKCWQPIKKNFDPKWTPPSDSGPSHTTATV